MGMEHERPVTLEVNADQEFQRYWSHRGPVGYNGNPPINWRDWRMSQESAIAYLKEREAAAKPMTVDCTSLADSAPRQFIWNEQKGAWESPPEYGFATGGEVPMTTVYTVGEGVSHAELTAAIQASKSFSGSPIVSRVEEIATLRNQLAAMESRAKEAERRCKDSQSEAKANYELSTEAVRQRDAALAKVAHTITVDVTGLDLFQELLDEFKRIGGTWPRASKPEPGAGLTTVAGGDHRLGRWE